MPVGQATIHAELTPERNIAAPIDAKPADVAFLLHTSGTTSRPKLVPITHGAVAANLEGLVKTYALSSKDVAMHVLPFFHVAGIVIGLLSTLAAGGCVVIHPAFDPLAFPQLLRKHKVTWFTAVPAIFKAFLEHKGLFETQVRSFIFAYKISQYISHLFFLSICPFRVVLFRPCALCALVLPP